MPIFLRVAHNRCDTAGCSDVDPDVRTSNLPVLEPSTTQQMVIRSSFGRPAVSDSFNTKEGEYLDSFFLQFGATVRVQPRLYHMFCT